MNDQDSKNKIPHIDREERETLKKRIFHVIQIGQKDDSASRFCDYMITTAIILNITVLILGTFDELARYQDFFRIIEGITVAFFCIEYACRIWTAGYLYPDRSERKARLKFLCSFDGIVDLLTILPFFFLEGFVVFRVLRVARILHLFRINAYYDSFNVITSVLYEKRNQLISSIFIIMVLMVASSLCMYGVEHRAQPDVYKNAFSGLWWSMSTIFTVGYGDIYPITILGKIFAVITTFLGVGTVAIPTGIISAGFVEQYTSLQNSGVSRSEDMITITAVVDSASPFRGKKIRKIELEHNIIIAAILRKGAILVPADELMILEGDTLVYQERVQL